MTTCSPRKENLIKPGPAEHRPATFGHKGQVYDGWETRRRRGVTGDTHDAAIVRLAGPASGLIPITQIGAIRRPQLSSGRRLRSPRVIARGEPVQHVAPQLTQILPW